MTQSYVDHGLVFGLLRPCRHHLDAETYARWSAHLCGMCLTLRDDAGQLARATTHVDAIVVSVLAEAQGAVDDDRRAGPCPLRGMRPAVVSGGDGARLAASTALLLAADAVDDHVRDRDGAFRRPPLAALGARVATAWAAAGERSAAAVGFDPAALLAVGARQHALEAGGSTPAPRAAGPSAGPSNAAKASSGTFTVSTDAVATAGGGADAGTLAAATVPTEDAVAAAFAHTAALAGRPDNAEPLSEAGRLLGRLAHLIDAVADRDDDRGAGRWNPLEASGTSTPEALARCAEAVRGIRAALRQVTFDPDRDVARRLAHVLLAHETARALDRTAVAVGHPTPAAGPRAERPGGPRDPEPTAPWDPAQAPGLEPDEDEDEASGPPPPPTPLGPQRGLLAGCAAAAGLCCTCRLCCADEFAGPWSGKPRQGWCSSCCDGCDCCDCCDGCGSCGDCCCDC